MRPDTVNFLIQVTLGAQTDITQGVVDALKLALYNDFYGFGNNPRVGLAQTVYASRFVCPAINVPGVKNIQNIGIALTNIASPQHSEIVTIHGDKKPVLSLANISAIFQP